MGEMTVFRPEDMETAKQVILAVANVEIDAWHGYSLDLYRGAWLALDKSGVEASDDMLHIMGLVHQGMWEDAEDGEVSLESIKKYENVIRWDHRDIRKYHHNRAVAAEIRQEEADRETRRMREERWDYGDDE